MRTTDPKIMVKQCSRAAVHACKLMCPGTYLLLKLNMNHIKLTVLVVNITNAAADIREAAQPRVAIAGLSGGFFPFFNFSATFEYTDY